MEKEYQYFHQQINEIADYFEKWLHPSNNEQFYFKGIPLRKNIYQEKLSKKLSIINGEYAHNCTGCNLKSGINLISQFLNNHKECKNLEYCLLTRQSRASK